MLLDDDPVAVGEDQGVEGSTGTTTTGCTPRWGTVRRLSTNRVLRSPSTRPVSPGHSLRTPPDPGRFNRPGLRSVETLARPRTGSLLPPMRRRPNVDSFVLRRRKRHHQVRDLSAGSPPGTRRRIDQGYASVSSRAPSPCWGRLGRALAHPSAPGPSRRCRRTFRRPR